MIEIFLKLVSHQALDEWNERTIAVFVIMLLLDLIRRIAGRWKFRIELTNIAKKWVAQKQERALERGDSASDAAKASKVATNPHPHLNALLEELVDEFHGFRREMRNELDESLRSHRREVRAELDEEIKIIRAKISELN